MLISFQPGTSILSRIEPYFMREKAEDLPVSVMLVTPFEKLSSI